MLALFHLSTALAYALAIYYFEAAMNYPTGGVFEQMFNSLGGRKKFLTHLNLILQCGYFFLALLNDVAGTNERAASRQGALQKARDWVFTSLAFPLGTFVTSIFWTIYAYDRELILPSSMDEWFPTWLNHVMHTLPLVAAVGEQVLVPHTHQRGYKRLMPMFGVYLLYLLWLVFIRYKAGFWVYPVFDALDNRGRAVFLIVLSVPALFCYVLGEKLHVSVWGNDAAQSSGKKVKHR